MSIVYFKVRVGEDETIQLVSYAELNGHLAGYPNGVVGMEVSTDGLMSHYLYKSAIPSNGDVQRYPLRKSREGEYCCMRGYLDFRAKENIFSGTPHQLPETAASPELPKDSLFFVEKDRASVESIKQAARTEILKSSKEAPYIPALRLTQAQQEFLYSGEVKKGISFQEELTKLLDNSDFTTEEIERVLRTCISSKQSLDLSVDAAVQAKIIQSEFLSLGSISRYPVAILGSEKMAGSGNSAPTIGAIRDYYVACIQLHLKPPVVIEDLLWQGNANFEFAKETRLTAQPLATEIAEAPTYKPLSEKDEVCFAALNLLLMSRAGENTSERLKNRMLGNPKFMEVLEALSAMLRDLKNVVDTQAQTTGNPEYEMIYREFFAAHGITPDSLSQLASLKPAYDALNALNALQFRKLADKYKTASTEEREVIVAKFRTIQKDMTNLELSFAATWLLFSRNIMSEEEKVSVFLEYVAKGNQIAVERMAQKEPDLLVKEGTFTDYSGLTFNGSAHEYANAMMSPRSSAEAVSSLSASLRRDWAKDTDMCRSLEKYMDETTKKVMLERRNAKLAESLRKLADKYETASAEEREDIMAELRTTQEDMMNPKLSFEATWLLFSHNIMSEEEKVSVFLEYVAKGNQIAVERMAQKEPDLLVKEGTVTNYSGRTFNCTAYEYANWAEDTHMCRMLEKYMDEKAKEVICRNTKLVELLRKFADKYETASAEEREVIMAKLRTTQKDMANLELSLEATWLLFSHNIMSVEEKVSVFLEYVAKGNQIAAERMAQKEPDLLVKAGTVTDYSGRTFKRTVAYEYAYWAKDTHMCRMLEKYMDERTKESMLERCNMIELYGLRYEQHGVLVQGLKHFDMTKLITALDTYVKGYGDWHRTNNSRAMEAAWMKIGQAQRDLPVHVINEYCRKDRSFYPKPKFKEDNLPRVVTFLNVKTRPEREVSESLVPLVFSDSVGLGGDFALVRGKKGEAGRAWWGWSGDIDLVAVSHLDEVRTADLTQSRENLKTILLTFLHDVAKGNQDRANRLLTGNPERTQELLRSTRTFTDYSGRAFKCTAYEYAYWAKDTHMCRMLENHMDETTKEVMLERCNRIEQDGLTYRQHGVLVQQSKHFDMTKLIDALYTYFMGYGYWEDRGNWAAMKAAWMKVGQAQRDLPVHVINEYCREDQLFDPKPEFKEDYLPRVVTVHNWKTGSDESLYPLVFSDSVGLGGDFALVRGNNRHVSYGAQHCRAIGCHTSRPIAHGDHAYVDHYAVIHLDKVRTADLTQSLENLKPVDPDLSYSHSPGMPG